MSMPTARAASSTLVPLLVVVVMPSILRVTVSSAMSMIALAANHVHHPERRDDVGEDEPSDHLGERADDVEAGRPHPAAPRLAGTITDDVEAQFAVAGFGVGISLGGADLDAVDDQ